MATAKKHFIFLQREEAFYLHVPRSYRLAMRLSQKWEPRRGAVNAKDICIDATTDDTFRPYLSHVNWETTRLLQSP